MRLRWAASMAARQLTEVEIVATLTLRNAYRPAFPRIRMVRGTWGNAPAGLMDRVAAVIVQMTADRPPLPPLDAEPWTLVLDAETAAKRLEELTRQGHATAGDCRRIRRMLAERASPDDLTTLARLATREPALVARRALVRAQRAAYRRGDITVEEIMADPTETPFDLLALRTTLHDFKRAQQAAAEAPPHRARALADLASNFARARAAAGAGERGPELREPPAPCPGGDRDRVVQDGGDSSIAGRGRGSRTSSSRRSSGSRGTTATACSNRSAMFRRPSSRRPTMTVRPLQSAWPFSRNELSGKPWAVQILSIELAELSIGEKIIVVIPSYSASSHDISAYARFSIGPQSIQKASQPIARTWGSHWIFSDDFKIRRLNPLT
jgi:hypothetical protein